MVAAAVAVAVAEAWEVAAVAVSAAVAEVWEVAVAVSVAVVAAWVAVVAVWAVVAAAWEAVVAVWVVVARVSGAADLADGAWVAADLAVVPVDSAVRQASVADRAVLLVADLAVLLVGSVQARDLVPAIAVWAVNREAWPAELVVG